MTQPFELELFGGAAERSYRRLRPGVDDLPWGTLRASDYPPALVAHARASWTEGAFREYCTAAAFCELGRALLEARAPLDLVGMAGDFLADEVLHTELNARMAMELGGGAPYRVDLSSMVPAVDPAASPRMRAAELAVRICCVGETYSVPVLAGSMRAASHPLTAAILLRIAQDEAPHAQLGWLFLEWADGWLDDAERAHLGRVAAHAIAGLAAEFAGLGVGPSPEVTRSGFLVADVNALGWMEPGAYAALCRATIARDIVEPLSRFGIFSS
jgi:hypothetical protein